MYICSNSKTKIMKRFFFAILGFFLLFSCSSENETNESKDTVTETERDSTVIVSTIPDSMIKNEKEILEKESDAELIKWENPLTVFVNDPGGQPTNIRHKPKGDVLLQLPNPGDYMLTLTGVDNGWFKVKDIYDFNEDKSHTDMNAYIHGSVISASTRNYGQQKLHLYNQADENSKIVFSFNQETIVFFISTNNSGNWIKVKIINNSGTHIGWIQKEWLCGNPVTNCS